MMEMRRAHRRGNRRGAVRVAMPAVGGYVVVPADHGAALVRVEVLDLSSSGARLQAPERLAELAEFVLMLRLPVPRGSHIIRPSAEPMWREVADTPSSIRIGVRFRPLSVADQAALEQCLFALRWRQNPSAG